MQKADSISLIPGGFVQFYDIPFRLDPDDKRLSRLQRTFWEYSRKDADNRDRTFLMCLEYDPDTQVLLDRKTGQRAIDPNNPGDARAIDPYSIRLTQSLDVYVDHWLPLPLFRTKTGVGLGPTNWARAMVTRYEKADNDGNTHVLTLAFDTRLEDRLEGMIEEEFEAAPIGSAGAADEMQAARRMTSALDVKDESQGSDFALFEHENDCGWFLNLGWVDAWLEDLFREHIRQTRIVARGKDRELTDEDFPYACEHLAQYLSVLQLLAELRLVPGIRLINPENTLPVEVDLILDVGNSRTCGMLVEHRPDEPCSLNDSYALEIRDLTRPSRRYSEPFDSRVEFSLARFGDPNQRSRDSERMTEAFDWPTVMRVGHEAAALSVFSKSAEGRTGMSSPKRYIWDEYPRKEQWRFNSGTKDPEVKEEPVVKGSYVATVNNEGMPFCGFDRWPAYKSHPAYKHQYPDPVTSPKFSRSSLMMFMLSEIIAHALVTINTPEKRASLARADVPRRLRRIVLTMPPAMPIAERKILLRRAEWAIENLWESLEWSDFMRNENDYRCMPKVHSKVDEASATQIVYLYNEIVERYHGDIVSFFGNIGRTRGHEDRPSLRLASIDIGGGTTDLIITTYRMMGGGAAAVIEPEQAFREGFNVAGDDILKAVIEAHLLHPLKERIRSTGIPDAEGLVNELLGGDRAGQTEQARRLRAQFAIQVAHPAGIKILSRYERFVPGMSEESVTFQFGDFFTPDTYPARDVINYVNDAVRKALAASGGAGRSFDIEEFETEIEMRDVDRTVRARISPILDDLTEIVSLYDVDMLLLSGRPTRQPAPRSLVLERLAVPPHRVIAMHDYRVGDWYPFRNLHSRISDPKTTVSVGALLGTLADGYMDWFRFHTHLLKPRSTARYIGEMEISGQIMESKTFFDDIDLDGSEEVEEEHSFDFYAPIMIGFRQLRAERWKAVPFCKIEFVDKEAADKSIGKTPYKVELSFRRRSEEDAGSPVAGVGDIHAEGVFAVVAAENKEQQPVRPHLRVRLQTLKDEKGYWLDTGSLFSV